MATYLRKHEFEVRGFVAAAYLVLHPVVRDKRDGLAGLVVVEGDRLVGHIAGLGYDGGGVHLNPAGVQQHLLHPADQALPALHQQQLYNFYTQFGGTNKRPDGGVKCIEMLPVYRKRTRNIPLTYYPYTKMVSCVLSSSRLLKQKLE
jgi:hypothetical protein